MRFSILALGIGPPSANVDEEHARQLSRFIAEHNVSCICLYGCGMPGRHRESAHEEVVIEHNVAQTVTRQLGTLGLKYDCVWDWSRHDGRGRECGAAVLTQLPILAHLSRTLNAGDGFTHPDGRKVVAARLGVSPEINVDVFSADISGTAGLALDRIGRLVHFMNESSSLLEPELPPQPRRRGRPPRHLPPERRLDPARLVFLAGRFDAGRGETGSRVLRDAGFVSCRESVTSGSEEIALGVCRSCTSAGPNGVDAVYLRPGLRPTDGWRVVTHDESGAECSTGALLGFEV